MRRAVIDRLGLDAFRGPLAQRIEAFVARDGARWRMRLFVRDAQGTCLGQRELVDDGAAGDEIAAAGALAIALSIDPDAPLLAPPAARPAVSSPAPPRVERVIFRERAPYGGADTALRAVGLVGMLPCVAPSFGLGVQVVRRPVFALEASVLVAPAVDVRSEAATFGFGLTALGLAGCGAVARSPAARLSICGGLLGGIVLATVTGSARPQPAETPWLALTLGARLAVPIAGPLSAEFAVDAVSPLTRLRFVGERQDAVVFEQPLLGATGSIGLGITFR